MNRDSLVLRAQARYRDLSAAVVTPAQWVDYINDSYMDVLAASPMWPFLEQRAQVTLAPGDAEAYLSLPTDTNVWRVTSVHNMTDDFPLAPLDGRSQYRHLFPDPAASLGTPQYYRLRNNVLEVYPRPSATTVLEADVYSPPVALAAADEPLFPEQYHRALVQGALRYAYEDDGNQEQAQIHGAAFDRILARMLDDLLSPRAENYPQVLDVF